jgi:hypothetical protein
MQRKKIIALILIGLIAIMVIDFRINDEDVVADFFMQFETDSMQEITNMSELGIGDERRDPEAIGKSSFSYQSADIANLNLKNPIGSIDIQGYEGESIDVTYEIKVYARNRDAAESYLEQIEVGYNVSDDDFDIFVDAPQPKPTDVRAYEVEFDIRAPRDLYLDLANRYGDVKVEDFKAGLDLTAKYNETIVNFVEGNININNEYGSLNVSDLNGNVNIDTSYNQNDFRNITGKLKLETAYTDNYLENIDADTEVTGKYGAVNFDNLQGDLELDIRYMGMDLADIQGKIEGNLEYGEATIESLSNDLDLTSRYADLTVWMVEDHTDLDVDVQTEYGNLRSDLDLNINRNNNTRTIQGNIGAGTNLLRIDARHADVQLVYEN